jgi:hypothetical protein
MAFISLVIRPSNYNAKCVFTEYPLQVVKSKGLLLNPNSKQPEFQPGAECVKMEDGNKT